MTRCYVCNAEPQDGCQGIDGERSECPRPSPKRAKKCPSGRSEHQMEPEWKGRSYSHMKCRWCNHREAV